MQPTRVITMPTEEICLPQTLSDIVFGPCHDVLKRGRQAATEQETSETKVEAYLHLRQAS